MTFQISTSLAALALGAVAVSATAEEQKASESALLVQHADSAVLSDGVLTLEQADKNLIIFADRPHRVTATIASKHLTDFWSAGEDSFASDPPNAALVGQHEGKPVSLVVELSDPQISGENFVYGYKLIEGEEITEIDRAYLVIDDCFACLGDVFNYAVGDPIGYMINPNDPK